MMRWLSILAVSAALLCFSCGGMLSQEESYGGVTPTFDKQAPVTPVNVSSGKLNVLVVTDIHVGRSDRVSSKYLPANQFKTWYKDNKDKLSIQMTFNLGDMTDNSTEEQYATAESLFLDTTQDNLMPLYSVPGNHDIRNGGRARFYEKLGPMYQALEVGDETHGYITFYLLDSSPRAFSKPQMEKLESAVTTDSNTKIFMTHYPLASNDFTYYYLSLTDTEQREKMIDLMTNNKVGLYLAGHRHQQMPTVEYTTTCHEQTLGAVNGLGNSFESAPSWYLITIDFDAHTATIRRYQWSDDGSEQGTITDSDAGTFALP